MNELPDEIWDYIKEFAFDWKRTHKQKFKSCISELFFGEVRKVIYERWTLFPPWKNTNDIIRDEYGGNQNYLGAPPPNLERYSITKLPNAKLICALAGYGWRRPSGAIILSYPKID